MKTEKNILIAFLLNLVFSILEFIEGIFTNSIAISSDAIHDLGDALSIGVSYYLERKSKKNPDSKYTYGYKRFSVLGSLITTIILLLGSIIVITEAIKRIINPVYVNYDGMIIFALLGVIINFIAAYKTKDGDSLNQKSVNLHMLEDVLGWIVVLIGSILIKITKIVIIDSILSIFVAIFILYNAILNLKEVLIIFLEKTPNSVDIKELKKHLLEIEGVEDIHHIHLRSIDGYDTYLTMHAKVSKESKNIKKLLKEELEEHGISHSTIEIETMDEECNEENCKIKEEQNSHHHHHH